MKQIPHTPTRVTLAAAAVFAMFSAPIGADQPANWEKVFSQSGAWADSTDGGGRARISAQPKGPWGFKLESRAFRVTWSTERAGRNPDFRVEIEKMIYLNNGGRRWQRYATVGRTHQNIDKKAQAFYGGKGEYRVFVHGHSMRFTVTVEAMAPDKD